MDGNMLGKLRVTDPTELSLISRASSDEVESITIPMLMKRTVESYGSYPALRYKSDGLEGWNTINYKEYRDRVEKMSKVFIKLGLERHGAVAVLAFNSVEWFVSELAAIHAGGIIAGIYTTNSVEACLHILKTSKANIVIVDDAKQMEKIRAIRHKLPKLKAVVQTLPPLGDHMKSVDGYWRWKELEEMDTDDVEAEYEKRASDIVANECCSLIYTSGTVGKSKGVMLSHDNICFAARMVSDDFGMRKLKESGVSYLPLSHVAAQTTDIFVALTCAGTIYFADRDAMKGTLLTTLIDARPTTFLGVPRVFEKIQEKLQATGGQSGAFKKLIASWAKRVTLQHNLNCMSGDQQGTIQYALAEKFVISRVKRALGLDNCRHFFSGAAPLKVETKKYFMSLDIKVRDVFGMSETSGPHCFCPENFKSFETIGKSLTHTRTKIMNADEKGHGEICIKGRHVFMGYLHDLEKTVEAIDDEGWLRTGDVGYMDKDEYIFITGRIKELIITAGGENISPVVIEDLVTAECSAISNTLLIGDKRKFLTMLVTLKTKSDSDGTPRDELSSETLKWCEDMELKHTKLSEVLAAGPDPKVMRAIQEAIDRANELSVSNAQRVQRFAILPHDFSISTGELGPTMKLRRNAIAEKYKSIIEKLYE